MGSVFRSPVYMACGILLSVTLSLSEGSIQGMNVKWTFHCHKDQAKLREKKNNVHFLL